MPAQDLLENLSAALHKDRWTRAQAAAIALSVTDSELVIEGRVDSVATKRRAVQLARLMRNEHTVLDRLRRIPVNGGGDGRLGRMAVQHLLDESSFNDYKLVLENGAAPEIYRDPGRGPYAITIGVENGTVALEGVVGSLSHRRLAEVLVWWIGDCEDVQNRLTVQPLQEDSDDELNDAIVIVLQKDPLIDASQLHLGTAAGIVQIEGLLADPAHRDRVIQDIWLVPGVWDVDDRIQFSGTTAGT